MSSSIGSVLVYGATGAQGSAIVRAALAAGAKVRILLREGRVNPFGEAVEVAWGDMADLASLERASAGMDSIALTLPQIPSRALLAQLGRNVIDAAVAAKVKLLVWNTTGLMPASHTGAAIIDAGVDTSAYLAESGLPAIHIRPTLYMGNLAAPWSAPAIVRHGILPMPLSADSPVSWISHEDLAAYVIEALRRPHLAGQAFDVGGPDALTGHEVAQVLSSVTGRPVTPFQVPLDELAASLGSVMGPAMGAEIATHYGWIQRQPASLFAIDLWPTLAELPVRPTSFADWAAAHDWQQLASRDQAA